MPTITTHNSRSDDLWRPSARRPLSASSLRSQAVTPTSSYFSSAPSSPTKSIGLAGLNEAQDYQIDSTVPVRMRLDGVDVEWAPGREGWRLGILLFFLFFSDTQLLVWHFFFQGFKESLITFSHE